MHYIFKYLIQLFTSRPSAAPAPAALDERILIMAVRGDMAHLENLAKLYYANHSAQSQACAPHKKSTFRSLAAQNSEIYANYEQVRCDIIRQIARYDNYCGDRRIQYSSAWNKMLDELSVHLRGISILGNVLHL